MSKLQILDLPLNKELDGEALAALTGGTATTNFPRQQLVLGQWKKNTAASPFYRRFETNKLK